MFSELCRVCMQPAANGSRLDVRPGRHEATVSNMLRYCFSTTRATLRDTRFPQSVCRVCVRRLAAAYKLKKTYRHTYKQLHNLLQQAHATQHTMKEHHVETNVMTARGDTMVMIKDEVMKSDDCDDFEDVPLASLAQEPEVTSTGAGSKRARSKTEGGAKRHRCATCGLETSERGEWLQHLKLHPYTRFLCAYCAKGFKNAFALAVHTRRHTRDKPFACGACERRFTQKHSLLVHERALHRKEKPFACPLCRARFPRKEALAIHARAHAGQKPYACGTCGARFSQPANLATHAAAAHTGIKRHSCSVCGFRTAYSSALKRHERAHRDQRDYSCTVCTKRFRNSSSLTRHSRIHTGELPYACAHCHRAFIDSWKRSQHVAKTHPHASSDQPRSKQPGAVRTDSAAQAL